MSVAAWAAEAVAVSVAAVTVAATAANVPNLTAMADVCGCLGC